MELTRKCEVCGKIKRVCDFSKSYTNRCKKCVAEHTRQVRKEAKQSCEQICDTIKKDIDWEQRRYEVAKSAMVGLMAGHNAIYDADKLASVAMTYADALIKELQKA